MEKLMEEEEIAEDFADSRSYSDEATDPAGPIDSKTLDSSSPSLLELDPRDDPKKFGFKRKVYHTIMLSLMNFHVSFVSSIYTSASSYFIEKYDVSSHVAALVTTLYVLGFAFSSLIYAAVSEAYGRNYSWFISFGFLLVFQFPVIFAKNFETILVARFLQGALGSGSLITLGASMNDIWSRKVMAIGSAYNIVTIFASPAVGPIIGAMLLEWTSLLWVNLLVMILGVIILLGTVFLKETYVPILIKKRARILRKTGLNVIAPMELHPLTPHTFFRLYLRRPAMLLKNEKALLYLASYIGLVYSLLYSFLVSFPPAFARYHHFSFVVTFAPNLSISVGVFITSIVLVLSNKSYRRQAEKHGGVSPEARLDWMCVAGIFLPIGLFLFGWTGAYSNVHWIVPVLAGVIMGYATSSIFILSVLYIVEAYGPLAASALGANGVLRSILAAAFIAFTPTFIQHTSLQAAFSFFGALSLILLPGPFILRRHGKAWRLGASPVV